MRHDHGDRPKRRSGRFYAYLTGTRGTSAGGLVPLRMGPIAVPRVLDTYSRCQRSFRLDADGRAATPPAASVVLGTGLCGHIPDVCQQRTQRLALLTEHLHGGRCARPQQRTDPFAQPGRLPR